MNYSDMALSLLIIIKLYCHIRCALHDELECSLALTHTVTIKLYKWLNASRMKQDWGNMNGSGTTTG